MTGEGILLFPTIQIYQGVSYLPPYSFKADALPPGYATPPPTPLLIYGMQI